MLAAEQKLQTTMAKSNIFDVGDYLCLSAYFVVIICVGIYSSFAHRGSVSAFFLAEQKISWFVVGTSLFASSTGTGHFIGLSGAAAKTGIGVSVFELHAVYGLVLLGWAFLPVYRTSGAITLPEYLWKRFGGERIRYVLSLLSLVMSVLTKLSVDLYAGAIFISEVIPSLSLYVSVVALVMISALFTITGGLTTVLWTDAIHTLVMIVGGSLLTALSLEKVGGYEELKRKYSISIPDTIIANQDNNNYSYKDCGRPMEDFFKLIHPYDTSLVPWTGLVFGLTVTTVWYFCADQVIVQRALSSSTMVQAKVACLLAAYFKFLPMWLMVIPGMAARVLFTNTVTCNEPEECQGFCGNRNGCNLYAFSSLVLEILPDGLRGLLSSVILSALVTSLASIFHSSATVFTLDLWSRIHRSASVQELMVMGRVSVLVLVVISIGLIPFVQKTDELFIYIQRITSYLSPPVTSIFLMAVFWKRTTEPAVFWGLTIGLVIGSIRFMWEEMYDVVPCGVEPSSNPSVLITKVHYLHFAAILFTTVTIFIFAVSCLSEPPPKSKYLGITFFSRYSPSVNPALLEESYTDQFQPGTQPRGRASLLVKLTDGYPYEMQPWRYKVCMWVCGLDSLMIPSKAAKLRLMGTSIFEPQKLAKSLHLNAVLALIIVSVYLAYFS